MAPKRCSHTVEVVIRIPLNISLTRIEAGSVTNETKSARHQHLRGLGDPGRPQGSLLPWTTGCELGDHKNRATAREPDDPRMRAGRPQGPGDHKSRATTRVAPTMDHRMRA